MGQIRALLYDATGHDREIALEDIAKLDIGADQLLWIDCPFKELSIVTGLVPTIGEAIQGIEDVTTPEVSESSYRFSLPAFRGTTGVLGNIGFVVSKAWLLTVSDPRPAFIDRFVDADHRETLKGKLTPRLSPARSSRPIWTNSALN